MGSALCTTSWCVDRNYFQRVKNAEISEEADYPIEAVTGAGGDYGIDSNESRNSAKVGH